MASPPKMTDSSEKFCLKWNDFQQNVLSSYQDLRKGGNFTDVTLVCDGDQQIEAHRIILGASSQFFNNVLTNNKHSHPMIYMRGLKAKDLAVIMDFIYDGEASIYQEDLDGFLNLAEELQLKGLARSGDDHPDVADEPMAKPKEQRYQIQTKPKEEKLVEPEATTVARVENLPTIPVNCDQILVAADTTIEDVKIKLDSLMEKANGVHVWKCKICGKTNKGSDARKDMRCHIETHLEGLSYPCQQCGTICRTSNALRKHNRRIHNF